MSGGFRVSDSTIETAAKAFWVGWDLDEEAPEDRQQCLDDMRRTLAAVLPSLVAEIEQSARREAVDGIEGWGRAWCQDYERGCFHRDCGIRRRAAEIARGVAG